MDDEKIVWNDKSHMKTDTWWKSNKSIYERRKSWYCIHAMIMSLVNAYIEEMVQMTRNYTLWEKRLQR